MGTLIFLTGVHKKTRMLHPCFFNLTYFLYEKKIT